MTALPQHPSYTPKLAPSFLDIFGLLKDSLQGHHYMDDKAMQNAICQWLQRKERNFYWVQILVMLKGGRRLLTKLETVEK
jgi:hypothetical protein